MRRAEKARSYAAVYGCKDAVLTIRMSGVQTWGTAIAARGVLTAALVPPPVYVEDYSRALVCLSGDELDLMTLGLQLKMPSAIIVLPEIVPLFVEHQRRMCAYGIVRRPFTDAHEAMEWAARQWSLESPS